MRLLIAAFALVLGATQIVSAWRGVEQPGSSSGS